METYFLLGRYSRESFKDVSAERTQQLHQLVEQLGGEVEEVYAVLGAYDLVIRLRLPGNRDAVKASIEIGWLTEATFSTLPAISVEEFDRLAARS